MPRIVRISYTSKSSNETLQSSSSHGSSTAASSSSSAGAKQQYSSNNNPDGGTGTTSSSSGGSGNHHSSNSAPGHDELFLLYRMVIQRQIYHGYNAKSQASQRKKTVLIPQEFPGESRLPKILFKTQCRLLMYSSIDGMLRLFKK